MKIRAIVTGASGMVGEGVLHECLQSSDVEQVLVIGRKHCGTRHPKLKEILHSNFFDISPLEVELKGYTACFFCLGVSSIGMNEAEYSRMTYDLTIHVAEKLAVINPDITFCYVSGAATDSSETGSVMWARVKGRTENKLIALFGPKSYNFRPGYMQPTQGLKNALKYYWYVSWLYPLFRLVMPGFVTTLAELGRAMIQTALKGYNRNILEVKDIVNQAKIYSTKA